MKRSRARGRAYIIIYACMRVCVRGERAEVSRLKVVCREELRGGRVEGCGGGVVEKAYGGDI